MLAAADLLGLLAPVVSWDRSIQVGYVRLARLTRGPELVVGLLKQEAWPAVEEAPPSLPPLAG